MSRCHLEADGGDCIVIGWDPPPLRTFFCMAQFEADGIDAEPRLWVGALPGDVYDDPDPVIDAIAEYAPPFDRAKLREELMKDRGAVDPEDAQRTYSL